MEDEPTPNQRRVYKVWFEGNGKISLSPEDLAELNAVNELFERLCEKWEAEAYRETDTELDWGCYMNVCVTNYMKKMDVGIAHVRYGRKGRPISSEMLKSLIEVVDRHKSVTPKRNRSSQ